MDVTENSSLNTAPVQPPAPAAEPRVERHADRDGDGDVALKHHHFVPLDWRDLLVAVVINVMWGLNLIAIKMATDLMGPITAGTLRQAIVLLVCLPALRIIPGRMRALITLGLLSGGIFYIILNTSLVLADNVAALAIASQLGAPFSVLLGVWVLKEQIGPWRIGGIALAFAGVALLVFQPGGAGDLDAMALTVLASLIWSACSLIQRQLAGVPVLTIYAWVGLIGTLVIAPIAWWFEPDSVRHLPDMPLRDFGWVAFSGLGSTLLGQGGMSWLLQRHPISTVAPLTLLSPLVAIASSTYFFGTEVTVFMIIGGGLALAGVGIVTIRSAWQRDRTT
jgi:O-acetylserine/cysteine efflux transporter